MSVSSLSPRAAYIHVPFCRHRCGYCNFTLVAQRDDLIESYLEAVQREMSWLDSPRDVDTLYFGGGTPTHLGPEALCRLLSSTKEWFVPSEGAEVSVEANPADLTTEIVEVLSQQGVTRISLGAQSFQTSKLQRLERDHRAETIIATVDLARKHFESISLDLIFAAPEETLAEWENDLRAALQLQVDHISIYGLTYERGAPFWSQVQQGELTPLDEELQRAMYLTAIDTLATVGYEHYEVSNFAQPDHRSRHNETYWSGRGYFAVGPGAARYVQGRRETNHRSTTTYLKRVLAGQSPVQESETLSPPDAARERLVFGLRRLEGVDRQDFARDTGYEIDELVGEAVKKYIALGMLEWDQSRLRLTRAGLLVSDSMWTDFLNV